VAKALGTHGARLVIMGRRQDKLDQAVAKFTTLNIQSIGVQGDVRNYAHCQNAVQQGLAKFGRLDILVNGAAGNFVCPAEEVCILYYSKAAINLPFGPRSCLQMLSSQ